jgi:hypothetical protein
MDHPYIQNIVHMARQRREASVHVVESRQESNTLKGGVEFQRQKELNRAAGNWNTYPLRRRGY